MKLYKEKFLWDIYYFYNFKNVINIPRIEKVVLNSCLGKIFFDKKKFDNFFLIFKEISNQKPAILKSKKSISEFKLKIGDNLALKITLRKKNMYDFIYKLIFISIPCIKGFNGFSEKSFDSFGNYNFGINDFSIFPEIKYFHTDISGGLNINFVFKNSNIDKSFYILNCLNFPFKNV